MSKKEHNRPTPPEHSSSQQAPKHPRTDDKAANSDPANLGSGSPPAKNLLEAPIQINEINYKLYKDIILDYSNILEKKQKVLNNFSYILIVVLIYGTVTVLDNFEWGWLRQRHKVLSEMVAFHKKNTSKDSWKVNFGTNNINDSIVTINNDSFFQPEYRRNLIAVENLIQYKQLHDRMLQDALRLKAPILGFTFDINNFPLFLGMSLCILMALILFHIIKKDEISSRFYDSVYKNFHFPGSNYLHKSLSDLINLHGLEPKSLNNKLFYIGIGLLFIWATTIQVVTYKYTKKIHEKRLSVDPEMSTIYQNVEWILALIITALLLLLISIFISSLRTNETPKARLK